MTRSNKKQRGRNRKKEKENIAAEKAAVVQRPKIDEAQIQQVILIIKDCKERNKRQERGFETKTLDFLMLTHVLFWYLRWAKEKRLHEQARILILDIRKRNKQQEPGYEESVTEPMQRRLKELVGDQYWKKAHDYLAAAVSKISSEIHSAAAAAAATTTTVVVASSPSLSSASLAAANSSTATTNAVQMEAQQQEAAEKAALVQRTQIDEAQIETVDEEKFLLLITYLEWANEKILHQQALIIIKDCKERNRRLELGYESVAEPMQRRLKELVGDQHWKQVDHSFMYVLIEYLERNEKSLYEQATIIIQDCDERNKRQESGYESVTEPMLHRLKELVGDQHWKKAHDFLAAAVSKNNSESHSATVAAAVEAAVEATAVEASSPSLASASLATANSSTATTNAAQVCYHGSPTDKFVPRSYFQTVISYVKLRIKYAGTDDTVLHVAKTKFFRDTNNRKVLLDPSFVKFVFALAVMQYFKFSSEEKERYLHLSMKQRISTASYELEKILDLGILVKYFVIPDANKEIIDYEKFYRYNREIDSERGIIRCLFRETHAHCDCMQTKKLEAHTMDKLEQCQGCGTYDYHHKMKTCTGCYCVVYCQEQCAKEDWSRHQSVCNKIREKKKHACATTKMDDNNNGNEAARCGPDVRGCGSIRRRRCSTLERNRGRTRRTIFTVDGTTPDVKQSQRRW